MRRGIFLLYFLLFGGIVPANAQDYDANPSGRSLYALADLRLAGADGEPSWLDGGPGASRFGGGDDEAFRVRPRAVEADLVWQPHLSWALDATVAAIAQQGQQHPIDISQAYLTYRHAPIGDLKLSARAGLFWPPVSLEHSGPAWTVTETITPSAINSWIGEEVKVAAGEASASLPLRGGRLSLTAALFAFNDTAGTLLAFRGWALHDEKATAFGLQKLPPLNAFLAGGVQAAETRPMIDLDNRPGFYGKLGWSRPGVTLSAFYYDNRGNPQAADADLQWGWRTRFGVVSAQAKEGNTTLTAQALLGTTQMGYSMNGRLWIDTNFRSAYLLATQKIGPSSSLSGRIEGFRTRGEGSVEGPEGSEDGWAATIAGRLAFSEHFVVLGEVLRINSRRRQPVAGDIPADHNTLVTQMAARFIF